MLAGTASGTIIALIPNAVLGAILKIFLQNTKIIEMIIHAAQIFQLATPLIIGGLIAFSIWLNATENDDCSAVQRLLALA